MSSIKLKVEFLGGLDAIFNHVREHKISLPYSGEPPKMSDLIRHLADNVMTDKKDHHIFIEDGSVRPGILVLINDTDWELEGEDEYELEAGDVLTFTSTLHGG
ncbi:hypothetical protein BABINDRAFT_163537 [Babjeviella inositovora NRRL Y-12698]|uniref:Ubiquitin-related modifier 1 n=1 Tax=Babjeviella inositovora NRRL Y-12698 TaxID=984486 RepID=A0A1E3QIV4_9ASCO|nr:uncharacterized protein BABINDRAFT_163537 [Babjeviella inositovora NRRL Y-12698]ODQ77538.1 hypothetical protein BABINDRAFT_163537 [Babjeviella inositovora NRRL Y-12698]